MNSKLERGLISGTVFALIFYTFWILFFKSSEFEKFLHIINPGYAAFLLILLVASTFLKYIRWSIFLKAAGIKMPLLEGFKIHLAGLAGAPTPGKAGDLVKSLLLKKRGVPYRKSLPTILMERLTDVVALSILSIGVGTSGSAKYILIGLSVLLAIEILKRTGILNRVLERLSGQKAGDVFGDLLSTRVLVSGVLWDIAGWFVESLILKSIASTYGVKMSSIESASTFALSILLGSLAMLPGGIGLSEISMSALLVMKGAGGAEAGAITFYARMFTLWASTIIGLCALLLESKRWVFN